MLLDRKAKKYWPGLVLFSMSLLVASLVYKDYGVSWDEKEQRGLGRITYNYVVNGDNMLKTYDNRGLGSGFELPLFFMEKRMHFENERDVYFWRHIVTHIFFLIGVFCGYVLALRIFKSRFIACMAFILLAFDPRIYAHSFFNTKDVPFLAALLIVMMTCHIAFEKNKPSLYLMSGIACGYATSIRAMGILFAMIIAFFFLSDIISKVSAKERVLPAIRNVLLFLGGFCGMLYLSWPLLWSDPVFYFIESFHNLSNIGWNGKVLFNGTTYNGNALPLSYMPVWFSITVPELWLAAGLTGFILVIGGLIKTPAKYLTNTPERNYIFYAGCFAIPVIAMTVLHGVNIDDWRHLYFIYPPFVMLALYAINKFAMGKKRAIVRFACMVQIGFIAFFMVRNHPFQQVYFNNLVSHKKEYLRRHYDLEYWGCAYKQGVDFILVHDTSSVIRIGGLCDPIANAVRLLPGSDAKKITIVGETESPDYFITNFRMHPEDFSYPNVFYNIEVLNSTILRIYKLKK